MGFYKAFGLEPHEDRPDSISIEFEFMHYLIFKRMYAEENKLQDYREKISVCVNAQREFFNEYLYPGAKAVAERIMAFKKDGIYPDVATQMLDFLTDEKRLLKNF
jgi:TorA maturation chaperone TorD